MNQSNRFHSLDSLRGIACLQVLIGHCVEGISSLEWMYKLPEVQPAHNWLFYLAYSPLHMLVSGPNAVKLFFILSGFVLSLPFYNNDVSTTNYIPFFIKRILRIYLPCLAIICVVLCVKWTIYNPEATLGYGHSIKGYLGMPIEGFIWVEIFLLLNYITTLLPVVWTLPPEIKLSLILPFFVYLLKRVGLIGCSLIVLGFTFLYKLGAAVGIIQFWPDFVTLYYMTFFLLGAVVCKYRQPIMQWIDSLQPIWFYTLLIISLYLYTFDYSLWWLPEQLLTVLIKYRDYVVAIPSVLFLLFALSKQLDPVFSNRYFVFIGKISFSLYLVHHIVILSCVYLLGKFVNQYFVIGLALACSFPLSYLFYKWVEIPSLNTAKKTADSVAGYLNSTKRNTNKQQIPHS